MGRSQETFNKKEREKKRDKKREEKRLKKEARKADSDGGGLDSMIAYVDEFGNITDTPPDPKKKTEVDVESIDVSGGIIREEVEEESPFRKGVVTFFNDEKGFGFIRDKEVREDYFVHINNVEGGELKENNMVQFELERGPKGMVAVNVKLIK
ncbi:MAG: DNA-binding protein [Crocinitomicaceae bacterium]|nr:DNA-binding protein [Crocinitomicaceae bacterium]|tara:strand:+ start:309 stop:767 length:459 start_codon:yes stop_codon:yes gene_type:complete